MDDCVHGRDSSYGFLAVDLMGKTSHTWYKQKHEFQLSQLKLEFLLEIALQNILALVLVPDLDPRLPINIPRFHPLLFECYRREFLQQLDFLNWVGID